MKSVPEIRFPGFTDLWEERKLGDVCSRVQGNDGRMELPTLTISAANGWMKQEDRFSGNIAGKEQKNYTLLHKGELSYNHGNSKLAKYGTVFSLQTYEEALVPRVYHSFKVEIGNADFIEYYFATKIPDRELKKLISSGARMDGLLNIGYNDFMGIKIMLPSTSEQVKIAEYFRSLDYLITLHQRELDEIKALKKCMLLKMFPKNGEKVPEIRFPGFTDSWEQRKFKDLFSSFANKDFQLQSSEYCDRGRYPIIDQGKKKIIGYSDNRTKVCDKFPCIIFGDHTTELKYIDFPFIIGADGVKTLSVLEGNALFQYYNLQVNNIQPTGYNRHFSMLKEISLYVPNLEEQEKIGTYFDNLDNLITLQERKCKVLRELKKYMLQKMFV